jgi:hypothetical protein
MLLLAPETVLFPVTVDNARHIFEANPEWGRLLSGANNSSSRFEAGLVWARPAKWRDPLPSTSCSTLNRYRSAPTKICWAASVFVFGAETCTFRFTRFFSPALGSTRSSYWLLNLRLIWLRYGAKSTGLPKPW